MIDKLNQDKMEQMYMDANNDNHLRLSISRKTDNYNNTRLPSQIGFNNFYQEQSDKFEDDTGFGEQSSPKFNNSLLDENEIFSPDPEIEVENLED